MASAMQKKAQTALNVPATSTVAKHPSAEVVTSIATDFLKRLGNKRKLKPRKVSLDGQTYIVEVDMKKRAAIIKIDATTREIKEYEIQAKTEEEPSFMSVTSKTILLMFGIAAAVYFIFTLLGVQSLL